MTTRQQLPLPTVWKRAQQLTALFGLMVTACGVWILVVAAIGAQDRTPAHEIYLLSWGVTFTILGLNMFVLLSIDRRSLARAPVRSTASGLVIDVRPQSWALLPSSLAAFIGCLAIGYGVHTGTVTNMAEPGDETPVTIMMLVGAALCFCGVVAAFRPRTGPAVILTPTTVTFEPGTRREFTTPWEALLELRPVRFKATMRVEVRSLAGRTDYDASLSCVGPLTLQTLLHYYWQHPQARDELADRRSRERLLERRFGIE